jgi:hypothetical protein
VGIRVVFAGEVMAILRSGRVRREAFQPGFVIVSLMKTLAVMCMAFLKQLLVTIGFNCQVTALLLL